MGLNPNAVKLLIRTSPEFPKDYSILTLGVQKIYASYNEVVAYFKKSGLSYCEIPPTEQKSANILFKKKTDLAKHNYIHPETFFRMMGAKKYDALDVFGSEEPSIIHDLSQPIPTEFHSSFDLIVDGGTTSHVSSTLSVLTNVHKMLKLNGLIIHIIGISGFVNHAFYQISPCLLYEYYAGNGFSDLKSYIFIQKRYNPWSAAKCFEYKYSERQIFIENLTSQAFIFFVARKTEDMKTPVFPIQGRYASTISKTEEKPGTPKVKVSSNFIKRWFRQLRLKYEPIMLLHFLYKHLGKDRRQYFKL